MREVWSCSCAGVRGIMRRATRARCGCSRAVRLARPWKKMQLLRGRGECARTRWLTWSRAASSRPSSMRARAQTARGTRQTASSSSVGRVARRAAAISAAALPPPCQVQRGSGRRHRRAPPPCVRAHRRARGERGKEHLRRWSAAWLACRSHQRRCVASALPGPAAGQAGTSLLEPRGEAGAYIMVGRIERSWAPTRGGARLKSGFRSFPDDVSALTWVGARLAFWTQLIGLLS